MAAPELIRTDAELSAFLATVSSAPFIALDTETSGLDPNKDRVLLLQLGTATEQALVDAQSVSAQAVQEIFRPDRVVVLHNASFDLKMLASRYGDELDLAHAQVMDTFLSELVLRNGRKSELGEIGYALKVLALRYAGMDLDKTIRQGFFGIENVAELSEAELRYAARDVEATWKVFKEQLPLLEKDNLFRVAALEGSAAFAFAQMELKGAPLEVAAWSKLVEEAKTDSVTAKKAMDREFWSVADRDLFGGSTLNYDSDEVMLGALKKLGVEVQSVRRDVLLATGHPAAKVLAEYREHHKIVSSYGETFLQHVHAVTGRLHPRFTAVGATTGRASCSEPNLQNIPAGSAFRACFKAPAGRKLITADYAAAELRIIAQASKDPVFVDTLRRGGDLHSIVASEIWKKPVSKTESPELRARAKAINFGLAYGMGAQGLATQLELPVPEAEALLDRYFKAFPKIRGYLEGSARQALQRGYAESMSGRRFWFTDMRRDGKDEGTQLRVAKNMPIQGTNADMTKLAMGRIVRALRESKVDAFLVNMVHDELVVEAAEGEADRARRIMLREMMSAGAEFVKNVPIDVDAVVADTWSK
ncbi:DNA polymerase [Myxococcota bacterium]|nr:DNA polymerase [Myxococcota bacterium]